MLALADRIAKRRRLKLEQVECRSDDASLVSGKTTPEARQPDLASLAKAWRR
jgi:hypothetical protein